jgi:hypothetical protein
MPPCARAASSLFVDPTARISVDSSLDDNHMTAFSCRFCRNPFRAPFACLDDGTTAARGPLAIRAFTWLSRALLPFASHRARDCNSHKRYPESGIWDK